MTPVHYDVKKRDSASIYALQGELVPVVFKNIIFIFLVFKVRHIYANRKGHLKHFTYLLDALRRNYNKKSLVKQLKL